MAQGIFGSQSFRWLLHKQILDKILGLAGNIVERRVVEGILPERDVCHRFEVVCANEG